MQVHSSNHGKSIRHGNSGSHEESVLMDRSRRKLASSQLRPLTNHCAQLAALDAQGIGTHFKGECL